MSMCPLILFMAHRQWLMLWLWQRQMDTSNTGASSVHSAFGEGCGDGAAMAKAHSMLHINVHLLHHQQHRPIISLSRRGCPGSRYWQPGSSAAAYPCYSSSLQPNANEPPTPFNRHSLTSNDFSSKADFCFTNERGEGAEGGERDGV